MLIPFHRVIDDLFYERTRDIKALPLAHTKGTFIFNIKYLDSLFVRLWSDLQSTGRLLKARNLVAVNLKMELLYKALRFFFLPPS